MRRAWMVLALVLTASTAFAQGDKTPKLQASIPELLGFNPIYWPPARLDEDLGGYAPFAATSGYIRTGPTITLRDTREAPGEAGWSLSTTQVLAQRQVSYGIGHADYTDIALDHIGAVEWMHWGKEGRGLGVRVGLGGARLQNTLPPRPYEPDGRLVLVSAF